MTAAEIKLMCDLIRTIRSCARGNAILGPSALNLCSAVEDGERQAVSPRQSRMVAMRGNDAANNRRRYRRGDEGGEMILPADVARCEGVADERRFTQRRCFTCARYQAWHDDLDNEPERVVLMEPTVTEASECTSHIPMRKVAK